MGCNQIVDGTGNKYKVKVNSSNKLETSAVVISEISENSSTHEQTFAFGTGGFITITNAGDHAVLYIKNTSTTKHLHIFDIKVSSTQANTKAKLHKTPSGGTIISDAISGSAVNINLGSTLDAPADCFKGGDGKTSTGGIVFDQWIFGSSPSTIPYDGGLIIPNKSSICLVITTTGAAEVGARILGFFEDNKE